MGKLQRIFSSCNINLLLGSAFSLPYLQTLTDIEKKLSIAVESGDNHKEYEIKKEFFSKSILPIMKMDFNGEDFNKKIRLLKTLSDIIDLREASVVHKICNIFTTNYDNFIETSLEKSHIDYFDGFNGRINPEFSTANYGKIICKQTEFSGRTSESVSVNLYKLHGSLYWKQETDKIIFEDYKNRIEQISGASNEVDFLNKYNDLAIVNPEKRKFNSTVMNSNYYDQIRMLANELERQNTMLMAFGFSFADEHIMQIISRSLSANPTLTLLLFPYCQNDLDRFANLFKFNNNVFCYYNEQGSAKAIDEFSIDSFNELMTEIYNGVK